MMDAVICLPLCCDVFQTIGPRDALCRNFDG